MLQLSVATFGYALCCVSWAYLIGFSFNKGSDTYRFLGLSYFFSNLEFVVSFLNNMYLVIFGFGYMFFNTLWNDGKGDGWFFWSLKNLYFLIFPVGPYAECKSLHSTLTHRFFYFLSINFPSRAKSQRLLQRRT